MIQYVMLDLDDTILDFHAGEKTALRETLSQLGVNVTEEILDAYHEINDSLWKALERGEIKRERLLYERFALLFSSFGLKQNEVAAQNLYMERLGMQHELIPGAIELLETLSAKYSLYLVSNGTESVQKNRLRLSGIAPYFKQIFISQQIGANKPDIQFFEGVFSRAPEIVKEESVIIGDSLTSDIQGGINAGILTVWFDRHGKSSHCQIRPDHTVSSLDQIPTLLERL